MSDLNKWLLLLSIPLGMVVAVSILRMLLHADPARDRGLLSESLLATLAFVFGAIAIQLTFGKSLWNAAHTGAIGACRRATNCLSVPLADHPVTFWVIAVFDWLMFVVLGLAYLYLLVRRFGAH